MHCPPWRKGEPIGLLVEEAVGELQEKAMEEEGR